MGKILALLTSLVLAVTLWVVAPGAPEAVADVDIYQNEGTLTYQGRTHVHYVNGRYWDTVCSDYSKTVRCRTYIWAKPIKREGNTFRVVEGWEFNNLTYLPLLTRDQWKNNPLGFHTPDGPGDPGYFISADRQWRTECDTPVTGRNGCRSWIWGTRYYLSLIHI